MEDTVSTVEAAKILGSSSNHVRNAYKDGRLTGRIVKVGTRKMLRITCKSLQRYAKVAASDKRIGREYFVARKPRVKLKVRGYYKVYVPDHPRADCQGYVNEHYLVMEKSIGRYLSKEEVVHHINRKRDDNRLENLKLYATQGEHMLKEHSEFNRLIMKMSDHPKQAEAIDLLKNILGEV